ncbi:hypothetical protein J6590_085849 [Homalodisca vitripennis]|nr:hypothetical protein J6590_085849 [Homalodisca vitripennis]
MSKTHSALICAADEAMIKPPHQDFQRRGLQKIQVDEEETWKDRLKWRRLCTTTRENGNV